MTSNTTPSGECIYSGETNEGYAWNAFNESQEAENCWYHNVVPSYVGYKFVNSIRVKKFTIQQEHSTPAYFKTYTLQASNDNSEWIDIGTFTETSITPGEQYIHEVNNENYYTYYRIYFIEAAPSEYPGISVQTLQFYSDADITTSQDAMSLIGKYDYCSNALLSNATWAEAICNSEYFEKVLNVSVPKMTSNTAPSGVASANTESTIPHPAYYAFDGIGKTGFTCL